jgi:hypothetical protein
MDKTTTIPAVPDLEEPGVGPVLVAQGIEKAYRRGVWPARRSHAV